MSDIKIFFNVFHFRLEQEQEEEEEENSYFEYTHNTFNIISRNIV